MTTPSASSNDVFIFSVSGSSTQNFALRGGVYQIALAAVSWGSTTLNVLAADRVTYVPFQTWSANAAATLVLVAGSYQLSYSSLGTATLSLAQQPPTPDWVLQSLTQPLPIGSLVVNDINITTISPLPGDTELNCITAGGSGSTGSGLAFCGSGDVTGSGNSGAAVLESGQVQSGNSGFAQIATGDSTSGSSGDILIEVGNASGSGKHAGNVQITLGTVASSATKGNLLLQALPTVDPLVVDAVWSDAGVLTLSAGPPPP